MKTKCTELLIFVLFVAVTSVSAQAKKDAEDDPFAVPEELKARVAFWLKVYTQYTTDQVILHDSDDLSIIYMVVDFSHKAVSAKKRWRQVVRAKRRVRYILAKFAQTKHLDPKKLNDTERRIYELFGEKASRRRFARAARNIRAQVGQRDRFLEGLIRSGRYIDKMKEIFAQQGLPQELTVLPHVESSFNPKAYSKYGAAGIWQFTRSTGRKFLKITYEVDERWDPFLSTQAAARLLKRNYEELGNWPLAITAYNHGSEGIKRAKRRLASDDLVDIISRYRSRNFGFASKNFYAEFLAALEAVRNYQRYFGDIQLAKPIQYQVFVLPDYLSLSTILKYFDVTLQEFRVLNPALRRPIYTGDKLVPRGYKLRLPVGKNPEVLYAQIPDKEKFKRQKYSRWYRVRRGDSLSRIARRFGTTVRTLMALNQISNAHRIYAGQILKIPPRGTRVESVELAAVTTKPAGDTKEKDASTALKEKLPSSVVKSKTAPTIAWITVEPDETLGHYADWLDLPTQKLRELNGLKFGQDIAIGQKIKLLFSKVSQEEFQQKRLEYHQGIIEDFFSSYRIEKTITHRVRWGENIWYLANSVYELPFWLIQRYNPEQDLQKLKPGDQLTIPVVTEISATDTR